MSSITRTCKESRQLPTTDTLGREWTRTKQLITIGAKKALLLSIMSRNYFRQKQEKSPNFYFTKRPTFLWLKTIMSLLAHFPPSPVYATPFTDPLIQQDLLGTAHRASATTRTSSHLILPLQECQVKLPCIPEDLVHSDNTCQEAGSSPVRQSHP